MKTDPKVVLIVDHPLRDLGGCTLVADALARQGCKVLLCPMAFQEEVCFSEFPDVVVINYVRSNNFIFIKNLKASGIKVLLLDTEGGFYGDLKKYSKILATRDHILAEIDLFLVWGQKMYNYWKTEQQIPETKLVVTGAPRFDLYHSDHLPKSAKEDKIFLFNTKVSLANPQFQTLKKEKALYRQLGFSDSEIATLYKTGIETIAKTVDLVKETAKNFSKVKIVLRPHPHENVQNYQNLVSKIPSVLVSRVGDLVYWLPRTQVLIHRHCTTAIEAALMGIPAISPQWIPTAANLPDAEAISHRPQNPEEFMALLNLSLKGSLSLPPNAAALLEQTISEWLFKFDGKSHERVAEAILLAVPERSQIVTGHTNITTAGSDLRGRLMQLARALPFGIMAIQSYRVTKWCNSEKYFSSTDVKAWLKTKELRVSTLQRVCQVVEQ